MPFLATRSARSLLGTLLVAVGGLLAGCIGSTDYRPEAAGPPGEVTVVVDSTLWNGAVGEAFRQTLGAPIPTLPQAQSTFDLQQMDLTPQNLDRVKRHKNVVVAAALGTSSQEAEYLRQQFSKDALQAVRDGGVVPKPNLWRRQQQVYYLAASTPSGLAETIRQQGPALVDSLNLATRRRAYDRMFEKGRQTALEDTLMQHHGFAVNVQHDYVLANDTTFTGGGFVLMVRKLPDTWRRLFVWYKENAQPSTITRDWVLAKRDSLAGIYLQGRQRGAAVIDRRRSLQMESIDFLGRYAFETRGLWYMAHEDSTGKRQPLGGGGPFVNYTFYDREQERIYMMDGTVFAPDYDKREFLRQMEVIAYTFRTRPEARKRQRPNQQTAAR